MAKWPCHPCTCGSALGGQQELWRAGGPVMLPQTQLCQDGQPRLAPSPVPLWAVTITAMKRPLPSHPHPGSSVLSAAQPCHPAKINHSASHPPCVKRSSWEQGVLPRKQLHAHSTPRACTGQRPAGPCSHPPSTASSWSRGTVPNVEMGAYREGAGQSPITKAHVSLGGDHTL